MKKVKCIDNSNWGKTLTIGKVYDIIEESYRFYRIIDGEGNSYVYLKDRFEEVNEMKISILELERYIGSYQSYLGDRENKEQYFKVRNYLEEFGLYDIFDLIDDLVELEVGLSVIIKVLELVGVEVV